MQLAYNYHSDCSHTDNPEIAMNIEEVIKALKHHQKWRRGAEIPMVQPKYLGEVIERHKDTFEEGSYFEMISHYYFCEIDDIIGVQKLDDYEK